MFVPRAWRHFFLAAACALAPALHAQEVGSPGLQLTVSESGATIVALGRWTTKLDRGRAFPLSSVNSVEVQCNRVSMTCIESRAELGTGQDAKRPQTLLVRSTSFKVTEWTETRLTARTDTESGDLMLRMDLAGRQVQLSYWDAKPDAKPDAKSGDANGFVWVLR
jgi:hypothetical protein